MNVIIVGCGRVGSTRAEQLGQEGHDVTVVDEDGARVQKVLADNDIMGVIGNGASHSVLMDAGIEQADLLIAVTDSDELNLLCCLLAKKALVPVPEPAQVLGHLEQVLAARRIDLFGPVRRASEVAFKPAGHLRVRGARFPVQLHGLLLELGRVFGRRGGSIPAFNPPLLASCETEISSSTRIGQIQIYSSEIN